eukprot:3962992-Pyramimonas_sp.AAC.1
MRASPYFHEPHRPTGGGMRAPTSAAVGDCPTLTCTWETSTPSSTTVPSSVKITSIATRAI